MTFDDLIERARVQLDDTVQPYKWSDDELFDYALESVNTFLAYTRINTMSITGEVVAGDRIVDIEPYAINVFKDTVKLNGTKLVEATLDEILDNENTGTPTHYAIRDWKFYLAPVPSANGVLTYTTYISIPPDIVSSATIPIPEKYHFRLVYGVMGFAYLKQDADTYDRNASVTMFNMFRDLLLSAEKDVDRMNNTMERTKIHGGLL